MITLTEMSSRSKDQQSKELEVLLVRPQFLRIISLESNSDLVHFFRIVTETLSFKVPCMN